MRFRTIQRIHLLLVLLGSGLEREEKNFTSDVDLREDPRLKHCIVIKFFKHEFEEKKLGFK